jgi:hypothetical protein
MKTSDPKMWDVNHGVVMVGNERFEVHRHWRDGNMYRTPGVWFTAVAEDGEEFHEEDWPLPAKRLTPRAGKARAAILRAFGGDMERRYQELVATQRANKAQAEREAGRH